MKYAICSPVFLHLSINWSLCMPESTEGIPQGNILVTIFPACIAIKHAVAGAFTVKEYGYVHTLIFLLNVFDNF